MCLNTNLIGALLTLQLRPHSKPSVVLRTSSCFHRDCCLHACRAKEKRKQMFACLSNQMSSTSANIKMFPNFLTLARQNMWTLLKLSGSACTRQVCFVGCCMTPFSAFCFEAGKPFEVWQIIGVHEVTLWSSKSHYGPRSLSGGRTPFGEFFLGWFSNRSKGGHALTRPCFIFVFQRGLYHFVWV